jgi:hypothetical protein
MPIVHALREILHQPDARSFQLLGEDLALVDGPVLREAAARYDEELVRSVPAALREARERELSAALLHAHDWLRRYNRSLPARIQGYLALGERCGFEYPWPVVAVVGLCAVMEGRSRWRFLGLVGDALARVGSAALSGLAHTLDDVLLRTNRGIFADSVPAVLLSIRAHELRLGGEGALAEALLAGPLPAIMDDETRAICRALYDAFALRDGAVRFARLAAVTEQHFAREQAIFTYQMGPRRKARAGFLASALRARSVAAPRIVAGRREPELVFLPYALPPGFEMADHEARVEHFGRAFVRSITATIPEYHAAMRYVVKRFGKGAGHALPAFGPAGSSPAWSRTANAGRPAPCPSGA